MKKFYSLLTYQVLTTIAFLILFSYMGIGKQQFFIFILPAQLANSQIWALLSHQSSQKVFASFLSLGFIALDLYQLSPLPSESWRLALLVISLLLFLFLYVMSLLSFIKKIN